MREDSLRDALVTERDTMSDGEGEQRTFEPITWLTPTYFPKDMLPDDTYANIKRTCDADGDVKACIAQAHMLHAGHGVARDVDAAKRIYKQVCNPERKWTCSYADAVEMTTFGARAAVQCEYGLNNACVEAGVNVEFGSTDPKRLERADALYEKACTLGSDVGCRLEKSLHTRSDEADPSELDKMVTECEAGGHKTCAESGRRLIEWNWPKAIDHLRLACDAGHAKACRALQAESAEKPQSSQRKLITDPHVLRS